jgi:hypothetical protein
VARKARDQKVLRFWNGRLLREKQVIRDVIWNTLHARAPKPLPDYCEPMKPQEKPHGTA